MVWEYTTCTLWKFHSHSTKWQGFYTKPRFLGRFCEGQFLSILMRFELASLVVGLKP